MNDKYSTYPNVNPHTEKQGTIKQTITTQHLNIIIQYFQLQLIRAAVMLVDIDIFLNKNLAGTFKNLYI